MVSNNIFFIITFVALPHIVQSITCYETDIQGAILKRECDAQMDSCLSYDLTIGSLYEHKKTCGAMMGNKNACVTAHLKLDAQVINATVTPDIKKEEVDALELMLAISMAEAFGRQLTDEEKQMAMESWNNSLSKRPKPKLGSPFFGTPSKLLNNVGDLVKNCEACTSNFCNVAARAASIITLPLLITITINDR